MSIAVSTAAGKSDDAAPPEPLTPAEQSFLEDCESVIERGRKAFVEVGRALTEIRDNHLWRASHGSFEDYCKDRWDFGRAYASRLIGASETMEVLLPIGNTTPATESQTRPLLQFPLEDRPQVWQDVLDRVGHADGDKITARDVEREVHLLLCLAEDGPYKRRKRAKRKEIRDRQRRGSLRDHGWSRTETDEAEDLADQDAGPKTDDDLLGATCPNCGNQEVDEDGDCANCREPEVLPIRDKAKDKLPEGRRQGVGMIRANEAINCLIRIPKNDRLRKRGFQIVMDWIKHNAADTGVQAVVEQVRDLRADLKRLMAQPEGTFIPRTVLTMLRDINKGLNQAIPKRKCPCCEGGKCDVCHHTGRATQEICDSFAVNLRPGDGGQQ